MAKVVVLGAGVGGVSAAYELRQTLGVVHDITVISDRKTFDFTPSNPWVAVGWRSGDRIRVPLEKPLNAKDISFHDCGARRVHPDRRVVELGDGGEVAYDYLIIATGPALAFDEVPGLGPEHGHTHSICTTGHAERSSEAWERFCANPGPIVVGAVQGASCFGPAYEYAFILDTELRKRKIRDRVPMWFVTPEPYIGHLGLDGVGDTKGLLESELRNRHIKWITNAKVEHIEAGAMSVTEVDESGEAKQQHQIEFANAMLLPAFRGIDAVMGIEHLSNPRGFIVVDEHQRNPHYPNIYAVGVCVAIPPVGQTAVPCGTPKTGYMIESMVTATCRNIAQQIAGESPSHRATWNAVCLADFGDSGVAFVALPQIPPRNVNWASRGKWVHLAKIGFEKYFLRKVRKGIAEPGYERMVMKWIGAKRIKG